MSRMTNKLTGARRLLLCAPILLLLMGCKLVGSLECRYDDRESGIETVGKVGVEHETR